MSRRVPAPALAVIVAARLWLVPQYRAGGRAVARAEARLRQAIDLPRGVLVGWPAAVCDLVIRAQLAVDGDGRALCAGAIDAAEMARWPR